MKKNLPVAVRYATNVAQLIADATGRTVCLFAACGSPPTDLPETLAEFAVHYAAFKESMGPLTMVRPAGQEEQ